MVRISLIEKFLGAYSVTMHGEIYHQIGALMPTNGEQKKFSQLIFYDSAEEERMRRTNILKEHFGSSISEELINLIQQELHHSNELYKMFKPIGKEILETKEARMRIVDDFNKINIRKEEKKLYALPEGEDFGAIVPANEPTAETYSRDILIEQMDSKLVRISESHPACHPLGYALLHLTGRPGWSPEEKFKVGSYKTVRTNEPYGI